VWKDYRNDKGVIEMAGCCGGDATMAQLAALGLRDAPDPEPINVEGNKVRVKYVGQSVGAIPFDFGNGQLPIRLGASPTHRYADVTPEQAAWLMERIEIQIVPKADPPVPPPPALPVVTKADDNVQALRPEKARAR
jgi:hypothetical protein